MAANSSIAGRVATAGQNNGSPMVFGRATDSTLHQWYYFSNIWYDRSLGGSLQG